MAYASTRLQPLRSDPDNSPEGTNAIALTHTPPDQLGIRASVGIALIVAAIKASIAQIEHIGISLNS